MNRVRAFALTLAAGRAGEITDDLLGWAADEVAKATDTHANYFPADMPWHEQVARHALAILDNG